MRSGSDSERQGRDLAGAQAETKNVTLAVAITK